MGLSASIAFITPVGTPSTAMIYATGLLPRRYLINNGILVALACALIHPGGGDRPAYTVTDGSSFDVSSPLRRAMYAFAHTKAMMLPAVLPMTMPHQTPVRPMPRTVERR